MGGRIRHTSRQEPLRTSQPFHKGISNKAHKERPHEITLAAPKRRQQNQYGLQDLMPSEMKRGIPPLKIRRRILGDLPEKEVQNPPGTVRRFPFVQVI